MNTNTDLSKQPFHFFGSTCVHWAVGQTREEVIEKLAKHAGADVIRCAKQHGERGLYAWTCRVEAPQTVVYEIQSFRPTGAPISEAREYDIISVKGNCREIFRTPESDND